jgi:hypothetical protein
MFKEGLGFRSIGRLLGISFQTVANWVRDLGKTIKNSIEIKAEYEDESRRNRRLYNEIFLPKFAELIVAECLRQVEEQYKPVLEDEIMMKDTHWDGYVQCGVDSYVAIREHFFGVDQ